MSIQGEARVFDARICELGEGGHWHPLREQFFWFDILNHKLYSRVGTDTREWDFGEYASAAGWIDAGRLLIATETGLRVFDIDTGTHELIAELEADRPDTRSNDGRADPQGGFWIGTMSKTAAAGQGSIYRYYRGRVERLFAGLTIPNAICFAPDGRLAYFACTAQGKIMAQPLDADGWPVGAAQVFADLAPDGLNPDGAVVDSAGGLWNAQWGAGRVARYLPDGTLDFAVKVPGLHSSCPAFGGAGLSTLFITTALEGQDSPDRHQGLTYTIETGYRGQPEHQVIL